MFSRSSVVATTLSRGDCSMSSESVSLAARAGGARFRLGAMFNELSVVVAMVDWFWFWSI